MKYATVLLIFINFSCNKNECYLAYSNLSGYEVRPNTITPSGIQVDTGGYDINIIELDQRISKIEECILDEIKKYPELTNEKRNEWWCYSNTFDNVKRLNRNCLVIKVANYILSADKKWQLLDKIAPDQGCIDKGLTPTKDSPCRWRTGIQDGNVLVTPPALYLWELGRILTGCELIWKTPFTKCIMF